MSFDAGAIVGRLNLDASGFTGGMLQAEGIANLFPAVVTEFLANPLLGFAEVAKEAIEGVKAALEGLGEVTDEVGNHFRDVGLEAQKMGVSVQWLEQISPALKAAGGEIQGLDGAFRSLDQRVDEFAQGSKQVTEGFHKLGISLREALDLKDQGGSALFDRIREAVQQIPNHADAAAASMQALGRTAYTLGPLLQMPKEETDKLAERFKALNAEVTDADVSMGMKFAELEQTVGAAWEGIKNQISRPILQYVSEHFNDIIGAVMRVAGELRDVIGEVMPTIVGMIPPLLQFGESVITGLVDSFKEAWPRMKEGGAVLLDLAEIVGGVLMTAFHLLQPEMLLCKIVLEGLIVLIEPVLSGLATVAKAAAEITGEIFGPLGGVNLPGFDSSAASARTSGDIGGASDEFRQVLTDFTGAVRDAGKDIGGSSTARPAAYETGAARAGGNSYSFDGLQVNMAPIDTNEASTQIAQKIRQPMNNAIAQQKAELDATYSARRVLNSL